MDFKNIKRYLLASLVPYTFGAYNDYLNQYVLKNFNRHWDNASLECKKVGLELAPITKEADYLKILSLQQNTSPISATWVGIRCKTPGVPHDYSYYGSNYIKSTGVDKNKYWEIGEPNSGCSADNCVLIYPNFKFYDKPCGERG
jgi:hypothetical protein